MPLQTPFVSLRLRRFRRRFGIAAPKVVVRTHVPWQWFLFPALVFLLLLFVAAWLFFQRNEAGEMGRELQDLRGQILSQRAELESLRTTAGTRVNAVSIEKATQRQLLSRIRELELESAALKEDMLLFERLIPVLGDEAVLRLENFRVVPEEDAKYRYRLLVAFQPSRLNPEFSGRLQLVVSYTLYGRELQLLLPEKASQAPEYQFSLKHFLRREGGFKLPEGASLKGVEALILQGDTVAARKRAQF